MGEAEYGARTRTRPRGRVGLVFWSLLGAGLASIAAVMGVRALGGDSLTWLMLLLPGVLGLLVASASLRSDWPPGRWLRRLLSGLLYGALIVCVIDALGFPMFLFPAGSFLAAIIDLELSKPPMLYVILGRGESSMPSNEALGQVRLAVHCSAFVGTSMAKEVLRGLASWNPTAGPSGSVTWVDVTITDGGIAVYGRTGGLPLLMGWLKFPDIRLRWADIQRVEAFKDILNQYVRLAFFFSGGKGFSLQKSIGQNNLSPLVEALERHGLALGGRRDAS